MRDLAQLNELAGYEIDDLIAAGITPTPAEIVELSALGWQVQEPETRIALSRGVPVQAGRASLWPLTFYTSDWYQRIGCRIRMDTVALGYAMANCYTEGDLPSYRVTAIAAVTKWLITTRARIGTITEAISQVLQQDEEAEMPPDKLAPGELEKAPPSVGEVSARLAALCPGASAEFWERRCSYKYALDVLHCAIEQANESGKPLPGSPTIKAHRALGWAVEKIQQRHAKAAAPKGFADPKIRAKALATRRRNAAAKKKAGENG